MKSSIKKFISILIALMIFFSSVSVSCVGAYSSDYPEGVTASEALKSVGATDKLVSSVCSSFIGKPLKSIVTPILYSSSTLSQIVVGLYTSLGENADELKSAGFDVSPKSVGEALSSYKKVSAALKKADSWGDVKLGGVSWGVNDKTGFVKALGAAFSPFNDALYMLLCSGTFTISKIIKIEGKNGYENAIIPILNSLGCTGLMSQSDFTAAANKDKNSMVSNIILPLMNFVEKACAAPAGTLTVSLPSFAYFEESGQLDACIDSLISPITDNTLVKIATFLKIVNLDSLDFKVGEMLSGSIGDMAAEQGFKLAEIDLAALSKCGTAAGTAFSADKGKAYVAIMRWLIDTIKLNKDSLPKLVASMGKGVSSSFSITTDTLSKFLSADTDKLLAVVISLFSPVEVSDAAKITYKAVTPGTVSYTANLDEGKYKKALKGIDEILDEFIAEYSDSKTASDLVSSYMYTNSNVNSLLKTIYSYVEKQGFTEVLSAIGIDASPAGVASLLTENSYSSARNALKKSEKWSKVSLNSVSWNFSNGNKLGFENAVAAVLRPLYPALRMLLAGEDMVILNSIKVKGADGYNTAVIPILEALGCDSGDINTYKQYLKNADGDGVIKDILDPIFSLVDDVADKPIYTLTKILPNIIAFIEGGSLDICLNNLLLPITGLTKSISTVYKIDFDASSLTKQLDISSLLGGLTKGLSLKLPSEINYSSLATFGKSTEKTSKQTFNGDKVKYTYIKADQTAVFITILRFLVDTIKLPENSKVLSSTMGGGSAGAFSSYSSSILDQFGTMTTDETIEWLYNLLFKERAQETLKETDDYLPTILFEKQQKDYTWFIVGGAVFGVAVITGLLIFFNRKRLFYKDTNGGK